ncbi:MAG: CoA transferase, partial [Hyphomicrobium sp.]|nr:CoA transferase [Hyphomicrobium sp.]
MKTETVETLAARVRDGALLALPPDYSYVPMALVMALIRRRVRNLHLLAVPIGGLAADLLIGAGCVKTVEAAAVSLGEAGPAPRFTEAAETGSVRVLDSTCPAVHAALQATEKGVPFMPLGGLIGSDILKHRPEWKVVDDPL